jgi:nicotinamide phosphoribosyltransferase
MSEVVQTWSHEPENAALMSDFYKQCHSFQYVDHAEIMVSYMTPRQNRLNDIDEMVVGGIKMFVMEYLVDYFNNNFFKVPESIVIQDYTKFIHETFTEEYCDTEKIRALHRLGRLPVEIKALPEGSVVKVPRVEDVKRGARGIPVLQIMNTDPNFLWVTNFLESVMSTQLWYYCLVATVGRQYRNIVNEWYEKTGVDAQARKMGISEFGFRGGQMREGATAASMAFLMSFVKTATIPAIRKLHRYYGWSMEEREIGSGMLSTEHSSMCLGATVFGSEEAYQRHILTNVHPHGNLSMVLDSYDYWNNIQNLICGSLKQDILNRDGTLFCRGDSGDPVDVVCGTFEGKVDNFMAREYSQDTVEYLTQHYRGELDIMNRKGCGGEGADDNVFFYARLKDHKIYQVHCSFEPDADGCVDYGEPCETYIEELQLKAEQAGTVELLFQAYGGEVNGKGYITLHKAIRAIYGDSITPRRAAEIFRRLANRGFAANNVALGAGSFSMQSAEELERGLPVFKPYTRDTFGIAIKATYAILRMPDGTRKGCQIFKDPKTDNGTLKKSQKGMCHVFYNSKGEVDFTDEHDHDYDFPDSAYVTYFRDGKVLYGENLQDIRNRLWRNDF